MYKKIFIVLGCCLIILGIVGITKASLMPIKAIIGQHYLEVAWKESLKNNKLSKPWKSADFYMIGELRVPKLRVSRVILNSVSGEAMAWSIGRVANLNRALDKQPIILAGHRDSHMQFMSDLNIGDKIEITMSDGLLKTYIISGTEVSNKPEVTLSPVSLGKESLVLTTCWPFDAMKPGDQRYLIFAEIINIRPSLDIT
ncbi:sortase [Amylibacter sp.]|nr:sortase [Amylibacter sp.]